MSDYHDIITAAFPPDKAHRILQREQQRGIVASPIQRPSPRPTPQPTQRIRPVIVRQPTPPAPAPVSPAVIHHTQPQANASQHTGTIGHAALLFLFSWFGV